jgi:hypothetical protein
MDLIIREQQPFGNMLPAGAVPTDKQKSLPQNEVAVPHHIVGTQAGRQGSGEE